jgi:hypothetical protein
MIRQAPGPVPLRQAVAELIADSDERDQWMKRLHAEYRAGFSIGYELGVEEGRRQTLAEEGAWRRGTAALTRDAMAGPPFADLEFLRWGPDGRERFADPRPGDYPGRGAA